MAERLRIGIAPRSDAQTSLLVYWAELEGRPVADLVLSLLERALEDALQSGRVPHMAVQLMETEMRAREAFCVERHGKLVAETTETAHVELSSLMPKGPGDCDNLVLAGIGGPNREIGHYSSGEHLKAGKRVEWGNSTDKKGGK